ncbi:MAG: SLC13 family permease [Acidimicrobiales bacterium]
MRAWYLTVAGVTAAAVAVAVNPSAAGAAAGQAWPAFVLVAGLLLVGLVAASDGLFVAAGRVLGRACPTPALLFAGLAALIVVVSAVLNLDTAVAFLTPIAVSAGRSQGEEGQAPISGALLPACILLANAGSLVLPGSNLTNLIVVAHSKVSANEFVLRMALPWVAASVITTAVIAIASRRALQAHRGDREPAAEGVPPHHRRPQPLLGVGLVAIGAAVAVMLTVSSPSLLVAGIGLAAAAWRLRGKRLSLSTVENVLNLPVLAGLMGLAVGVGTLGRLWSGPADLLFHLDPFAIAAVAAVSTVLINNLPAASLLSARAVTHPLSLLIGLDVGPNFFVSGSLAWVLWISSARAAGERAGARRAVKMGAVAAPLAIAVGVAALMASGAS